MAAALGYRRVVHGGARSLAPVPPACALRRLQPRHLAASPQQRRCCRSPCAAAALESAEAPGLDPEQQRHPEAGRATAAVLLSLLFSGVSYPVSKACYALASPLVLQALRFSVGVCAAAAWHRRALRSDDGGPAGRRGALAVGALLALGYTLQSLCLLRVPPATAAFLTAFSVPLTPLVECALRRASPPPRVLGCGLAAAAGTLLLAMGSGGGAATAASLAGPSSAAAGVALGVGAALVFALYFVALSRVAAASPAAAGRLTVAQLGIVAAASWAAAPLDAPPALVASPALAAAVLAVGIASTAATFGLLSWAASRLPASRTSLLFAAEPVVAAAAAWALLGEGLGGRSLAGGLLVLLAIAGA